VKGTDGLFVCRVQTVCLCAGYRESRMLGAAPEDLLTYLRTAPVGQHHHKFSIPLHVSSLPSVLHSPVLTVIFPLIYLFTGFHITYICKCTTHYNLKPRNKLCWIRNSINDLISECDIDITSIPVLPTSLQMPQWGHKRQILYWS